jgi:hypothetical protein
MITVTNGMVRYDRDVSLADELVLTGWDADKFVGGKNLVPSCRYTFAHVCERTYMDVYR